MPHKPNSDLFAVICGLFCVSLIVSNVASAGKIIALGPFALPGGAVLFPITYLFGDLLTEVYGFERSRKIIWAGFGGLLIAAATFSFVELMPAASFWQDQETYSKVLGFVPRIVFASLVAYFFGEISNSYVLSRMKYWAKGSRGFQQASRFVISTVVGEGVDSVVFSLVAFVGVMETGNIVRTAVTLYIFKVLWEVVALPISLPLANWIKRYEGVDKIDLPEQTNYNPFIVFSRESEERKGHVG